MPIKSSGQLGITDVVNEFGLASANISSYNFSGATHLSFNSSTGTSRG